VHPRAESFVLPQHTRTHTQFRFSQKQAPSFVRPPMSCRSCIPASYGTDVPTDDAPQRVHHCRPDICTHEAQPDDNTGQTFCSPIECPRHKWVGSRTRGFCCSSSAYGVAWRRRRNDRHHASLFLGPNREGRGSEGTRSLLSAAIRASWGGRRDRLREQTS